jgi:hypothetical protein
MRNRFLHIGFLAFFGLWFGLVLPGHQRGIVLLPGVTPVASSSAATTLAPPCHDSSTPANKPISSKGCAVCFHMAMLDVPVFINHHFDELYAQHFTQPIAPKFVLSVEQSRTKSCRAPPA